MNIRDRHALKANASARLEAASYSPAKLILIHTGVTAALLLAVTAINFFLENQISDTGGLSGLGTRTVLTTIQSVLQMFNTIAMPFWQFGYTFAVLCMARGERAEPRTLLDGFRHFGPVLRLSLLKSLLYSSIAIMCFYPSMLLFMLSPLGQPVIDIMKPIAANMDMTDAGALVLDDATIDAVAAEMMPALLIFGAMFLLIAAPIYYRLRMADFALADNPKAGGFAAMRSSAKLMRRNCMHLLKLDLSFWWFYLLEIVVAVVCYGDMLLPMLGIPLPFSATTAYFVFYVLNLVLQIGLYWWAKNKVTVTYGIAYDSLASASEEAMPAPKKQPWNYE